MDEVGRSLRALVSRAEESGDLAELRRFLAEHPESVRQVERLVPDALDAWLRLRVGRSRVGRAVMEARLARVRGELLEPGDTGIERVLVERVLVCWLAVEVLEAAGAGKLGWQGQISAAHGRYLSALRALASVRRLRVGDLARRLGVVVDGPGWVGVRASDE